MNDVIQISRDVIHNSGGKGLRTHTKFQINKSLGLAGIQSSHDIKHMLFSQFYQSWWIGIYENNHCVILKFMILKNNNF